jgi:hypothetical protein
MVGRNKTVTAVTIENKSGDCVACCSETASLLLNKAFVHIKSIVAHTYTCILTFLSNVITISCCKTMEFLRNKIVLFFWVKLAYYENVCAQNYSNTNHRNWFSSQPRVPRSVNLFPAVGGRQLPFVPIANNVTLLQPTSDDMLQE